MKNILLYHKNGKKITSIFILADLETDSIIDSMNFSGVIGIFVKLAEE